MKLKLCVSLLAVLSLSAVSANAQESAPKVDVFAGYSYVQANPGPGVTGADSFHLHGGNASVAYNITGWLGGVADFGGYTNGNILSTHTSGTFSTYLFGPRLSYRHFSRIAPFGQVLFGAAHANAAAFGEHWAGAGRNTSSLVLFTLGLGFLGWTARRRQRKG